MPQTLPKKIIFDSEDVISKATSWDDIAIAADQRVRLTQLYTLLLIPILERQARKEQGELFIPAPSYGDLSSALHECHRLQSFSAGARLAKAAGMTLDKYRNKSFVSSLGANFRVLCLYQAFEYTTLSEIERNPQSMPIAYGYLVKQYEEVRPFAEKIISRLGRQSARFVDDALTEEFGPGNFTNVLSFFPKTKGANKKAKFRQAQTGFVENQNDWGAISLAAKYGANYYFNWIQSLYSVFIHNENHMVEIGDIPIKEINWHDLVISSEAVKENLSLEWGADLAARLGKPCQKTAGDTDLEALEIGSNLIELMLSRTYEFCAVEEYESSEAHMSVAKRISDNLFANAVNAGRELLSQKISADSVIDIAEKKLGALGFDQTHLAFRLALAGVDSNPAPDAPRH
jgi:hypothetical protein